MTSAIFGLSNESDAFVLLDLLDAEFQSDPTSVPCFDLRVVERVRQCVARRKQLARNGIVPPLLTTGDVRAQIKDRIAYLEAHHGTAASCGEHEALDYHYDMEVAAALHELQGVLRLLIQPTEPQAAPGLTRALDACNKATTPTEPSA